MCKRLELRELHGVRVLERRLIAEIKVTNCRHAPKCWLRQSRQSTIL